MNPLAWLYAQWMATPIQMREPIKSAFVSTGFIANGLGIYAIGDFLTSGLTFDVWLHKRGFIVLLSFLYGAGVSATYRSQQALQKAKNTVPLENGLQAVILGPTKSQLNPPQTKGPQQQ